LTELAPRKIDRAIHFLADIGLQWYHLILCKSSRERNGALKDGFMAGNSADSSELADIRRLASDPTRVRITKTVEFDLLAQHLTTDDICDEIVAWIDGGQRVKKVTLRGQHAGQAAFEIKPRINNRLFYLKVTLCELGDPGEYMLLISAHLDH